MFLCRFVNIMHELNPFVRAFKYALEIEKENDFPDLVLIVRAEDDPPIDSGMCYTSESFTRYLICGNDYFSYLAVAVELVCVRRVHQQVVLCGIYALVGVVAFIFFA